MFAWSGFNRHAQSPSDHLGNRLEWHRLVRDCVIRRLAKVIIQHPAIDPRRVGAVHPDQQFCPSPIYADTPVSRARRIRIGKKPWSPTPCIEGARRTVAARTPRAASALAAASDWRGDAALGRSA